MFARTRLFLLFFAFACSSTSPRNVDMTGLDEGEDSSVSVGDVFDVRVYGEEDMSGSFRVDTDGTIDFPFVGRVEVAGLEPAAIADLVEAKLRERDILREPQVSVFVREYNSRRVSVSGEVANPGSIPIATGLTLVQAITQAGGFAELALPNDTIVTRTVRGQTRRIPVRAGDAMEGRSPDMPLRTGDIVFVPRRVF